MKTKKVPNPKEKLGIASKLKKEFGEVVVYNQDENCIYTFDNQYLLNPIVLNILNTYLIYYQPNLFEDE